MGATTVSIHQMQFQFASSKRPNRCGGGRNGAADRPYTTPEIYLLKLGEKETMTIIDLSIIESRACAIVGFLTNNDPI